MYVSVCIQIAGLLASLVVLLVVVAIGFVFQPLPQVGGAKELMMQSSQHPDNLIFLQTAETTTATCHQSRRHVLTDEMKRPLFLY